MDPTLRKIEERKKAERKAREKDMFKLDSSSLDTFGLPGRPEPSKIMHHDARRKTKTKRLKITEMSRSLESPLTSVNVTAKEYAFLPHAIGLVGAVDEAATAAEAAEAEHNRTRPLSDLEEISEIMGRIHTGDDAINFFARFGSETPVSSNQ